MVLDEVKLDKYATKIYKGDLKRFKEKQKNDASFKFDLFYTQESKTIKKKREAISSPQKQFIIDKQKKCAICSKMCEDPDYFQFHHADGNRSHTVTSNLVLLCLGCHTKVHKHALAKLKDYKVINKKSSKTQSPSASRNGSKSSIEDIFKREIKEEQKLKEQFMKRQEIRDRFLADLSDYSLNEKYILRQRSK